MYMDTGANVSMVRRSEITRLKLQKHVRKLSRGHEIDVVNDTIRVNEVCVLRSAKLYQGCPWVAQFYVVDRLPYSWLGSDQWIKLTGRKMIRVGEDTNFENNGNIFLNIRSKSMKYYK